MEDSVQPANKGEAMTIERLDENTFEDTESGTIYCSDNSWIGGKYWKMDSSELKTELTEDEFCQITQGITKSVGPYLNGFQISWLKNRAYHRLDAPAIHRVWDVDGEKQWEKLWMKGGAPHRDPDDGPAVERSDGSFIYYVNGNLHREYGPANKAQNGWLYYYQNGQLHRTDGPAIIGSNGQEKYYLNNVEYSKEEFEKRSPDASLDMVEETFGERYWYKKGTSMLHRTTGPAHICADGFVEYYQEDLLHREDGPAIEGPNYKAWYKNGLQHRIDGPAIISEEIGLDGETYIREEWWQDDILHREEGPAIVDDEKGITEYWVKGKLHRTDGPAVEYDSGEGEYWVDGFQLTEDEFLEKYNLVKVDISADAPPPVEQPVAPKTPSSDVSLGFLAGATAIVGLLGGLAKKSKLKKSQVPETVSEQKEVEHERKNR